METERTPMKVIEGMSTNELLASADEKNKIVASLERKIRTNTKRLATLEKTKALLNRELNAIAREQKKIQECILARAPLAEEVVSIRKEFLFTQARVGSKDITIKEHETLVERAGDLLGTLQGKCDHRFTLTFPGYRGSHSEDYDDGYYGNRVCIVCGFRETSKLKGLDEYQTLVPDGNRLIKRILSGEKRFTDMLCQPVVLPLFFISNAFIHAEGDIVNLAEEQTEAVK